MSYERRAKAIIVVLTIVLGFVLCVYGGWGGAVLLAFPIAFVFAAVLVLIGMNVHASFLWYRNERLRSRIYRMLQTRRAPHAPGKETRSS